jgi:hypothetical protein
VLQRRLVHLVQRAQLAWAAGHARLHGGGQQRGTAIGHGPGPGPLGGDDHILQAGEQVPGVGGASAREVRLDGVTVPPQETGLADLVRQRGDLVEAARGRGVMSGAQLPGRAPLCAQVRWWMPSGIEASNVSAA